MDPAGAGSSPPRRRRRRLRPSLRQTDVTVAVAGTSCRSEGLHFTSSESLSVTLLASSARMSNVGINTLRQFGGGLPICRPRPRRRRNVSASCMMITAVILAASLLSSPEEVTAANSHLRREQRQHELPQQQSRPESESAWSKATIRQLSPADCIDKWHVSLYDPSSCTNVRNVPSKSTLYDTSSDCCRAVKPIEGRCNIIDACHGMVFYDGGVPQNNYGDIATGDYYNSCTKTTWHMSTEEMNACTNSGVYPRDWNSLEKRDGYLFSSAEECCEESYPNSRCRVIDTCPTPHPTPPPTERPVRTRRPRPSKKPTAKPTPMPDPTSHPTTPEPDWYVDRTISKCVMDCVDEPRRPCGTSKNQWESTFPTLGECCESINWIPAEECYATASPVTSPPTALLGDAEIVEDGPKPTPRPTRHFDWYIERSTNQCVQECDDEPGHPCGGLTGKWETRYSSVEECCATQPWKPFSDCQATASPITNSPTTPSPIGMMDATHKPTRPPRTGRPTEFPTHKPAPECPAPYWVLFKTGATVKCINDISYADDLLNPSMKSYLLFDTAAQCCASKLAGDNCQIVDVCRNIWFGDYSGGWEEGVCINSKEGHPVPKGRRTFDSQLECCLDAFLGQTSEVCVSFLDSGEL